MKSRSCVHAVNVTVQNQRSKMNKSHLRLIFLRLLQIFVSQVSLLGKINQYILVLEVRMESIKKDMNYFCKCVKDTKYLLNLTTNKIFEIDDEGLTLIRKINESKVLTEKEIEIKKIIESSYNDCVEVTYSKKIFHLQWHITNKCNLKCKHCYQESHNNRNEMSFESLKLIFDNYCSLLESYDMLPEVSLTGGEPLSSKHFFDLVKYIKDKRPDTVLHILTNGTLITQDTVNKFIKYGIKSVQISLDGHDSSTHDLIRGVGSFQKALNAIKLLQKSDIWVSVHCVFLRENIESIEEYFKLCDQLGVRVTFSRYVPIGTGYSNNLDLLQPNEIKELYEKVYDYSKKYRNANANLGRDFWQIIDPECGGVCPVGESTISILHDGSILPCRRLPIVIGNALEESLVKTIFKSRVMEKMKTNTISECIECNHRDTCKGGCQGIAFAYYGKLMDKPDPQCWKTYDCLPMNECNNKINYNEERGVYELPDEINYYSNIF